MFIHCKDNIVPCDGLIYLAGAARAIKSAAQSSGRAGNQSTTSPGIPGMSCGFCLVPRLMLWQYRCYCYLSTAKWSWHKYQPELQPQPHQVAQTYSRPLVLEVGIVSPLTHSDAHSIKACNIISAAKASIHKLGNADLYDAWALEMETASSSEQPQFLNAALLLL